ncbi:MATE family efflux transporter [Paenibacillus allorhizosphaerae]|uniref:Probable multidrug resistance protein NorM n=1 Tax=Paenibacillus allorhizosphaerae TaxID=2849866 RepID=A0ABM8VEQ2_9BACL|nr:MATE family efflux transporter [Paenibacillus allorhizosphaerae]CAG7632088.1 Multidrug resistance protein NorM [Paenibacillus allorhizosphaerae]
MIHILREQTRHWKLILTLALPSVISFASGTVTGTINLIMVGPMGALVIAVVGVSNIIAYNAWALCSGFGHSVNYLVAQNYGAGEMDQAVRRTYVALFVGAMAAMAAVIAGWLAPKLILELMGGSEELVGAGTAYLRYRLFAVACFTLSFVFHGFFRGIGDTRTPMAMSVVANAAMIFFTYALTYGKLGFPELGLPGAGMAVLIGEALSLLGSAYVYFFRLHGRYDTRRRIAIDRKEAKLIATESGKLGIQELAMSMAMFVFTMFVTRLGTHALAANEIALNVMAFGFMPAFAFGATATILVGQEIGRGDPYKGRRMGTDVAVLGSLFLLVLGLIEFLFAEGVARWYTSDPAVFTLAGELIMISAFLQLFDGLLNYYAGGLRGLGDTTFLLKVSLALNWLMFIPFAYVLIFVFDLGSIGAWISLYAFLTFFALAVCIRFYRTDWAGVRAKQAAGNSHI